MGSRFRGNDGREKQEKRCRSIHPGTLISSPIAGSSCRQGCLGLSDDDLERIAFTHCDVGQDLPVQFDARKPKEQVLLRMLREGQADGALLSAAKFCEPGLDDQLACAKFLDGERIPYLVLEFEEKMSSFEQLAMQVETFAESLLFE